MEILCHKTEIQKQFSFAPMRVEPSTLRVPDDCSCFKLHVFFTFIKKYLETLFPETIQPNPFLMKLRSCFINIFKHINVFNFTFSLVLIFQRFSIFLICSSVTFLSNHPLKTFTNYIILQHSNFQLSSTLHDPVLTNVPIHDEPFRSETFTAFHFHRT